MSEGHGFEGGCHCGAIRFEVDVRDDDELLHCNCSICNKKGFVHLIVEPERFRLLRGEDSIVEYRFNTRVAVHKFCGKCGIHSFYTPRSHPSHVDVNAVCLDERPALNERDFDGENWEDAIETIR